MHMYIIRAYNRLIIEAVYVRVLSISVDAALKQSLEKKISLWQDLEEIGI